MKLFILEEVLKTLKLFTEETWGLSFERNVFAAVLGCVTSLNWCLGFAVTCSVPRTLGRA